MPRRNRIIFKDSLYEINPRAREGLPPPATEVTNQLLTGILARIQRDDKVVLCNFVQMANHTHQHCIPDKPQQHVKFYMEYQKKICDTVRKLTKRRRLTLWEGRPSVIKVAELNDAINRLIYMFLNPVEAGLVETIDQYPGLNTWKAFTTCEPSVDAQVSIKAYWTRVSGVEPLPEGDRLSPANAAAMAQRLRESKKTEECELIVQPLAWLRLYGITDPQQIEEVRQQVISGVRDGEARIAKERREAGIGVVGPERLIREQYLRPHTPKKKERNIFVICSNHSLRATIIQTFDDILAKCRKCYQKLKAGESVDEWPPGTFIPWLPPPAGREPCF